MTKKPEFLKLATVAVMATGLLAGCATDGSSEANTTAKTETTQTAPMKKAGPNAAAKQAIYGAKVKNGRAKKAGYEWRDTGKLIKAAEKAAAKGDNDKAVALANKARQQALDALEQSQIEADRYEKLHGTASLTSTMMSDNMDTKDAGAMMDATATASNSDYTVIPGDNLWDISAKNSVYGNPYQWPLIYKANAAKIKDADLIYAGQVFAVPSASSSDVSAAINHAKTRGAWTIGESEKSDLDYVLGFK